MTNGDESAVWTTETDNVNSVNNVSSKKHDEPFEVAANDEIHIFSLTTRSIDGIGQTSKRCVH